MENNIKGLLYCTVEDSLKALRFLKRSKHNIENAITSIEKAISDNTEVIDLSNEDETK